MSKLFMVRSRCNNDVDSGRNSARAIAPSEIIEVDDRNNRLSAVLRVHAVRNDWIWVSEARGSGKTLIERDRRCLTLLVRGSEHGCPLRSRVSSVESYF